MAKTEITKQLEKEIYRETSKLGVFGCFEVTIGWYGKERVDYITYDTTGMWRCYEIKVSKADFHSKAKNTFIGHFNYYVMTKELYEEVKEEIPKHIGVYCGSWLIKRPKKQELKADEQILKNSMIRSLSREFQKFINTKDIEYTTKLKNKVIRLEEELRHEKNAHMEKRNELWELKIKLGKEEEVFNE